MVFKNAWDPLCPLTLNTFFDQLPKNVTNSTYLDGCTISKERDHEDSFDHVYIISSTILFLYILTKIQKTKNFTPILTTIESVENNLRFRLIRNQLIYFVISLLLLPFLIIILAIFFIYRLLVSIVLRIQYGEQFRGLMSGQETIWALEDISKCVITVKIMVENRGDDLYERVKEKFEKLCQKYEKLRYVKEKQYGYYYWLEKPIEFKKFIKTFDSGDEDMLEKRCNDSMPLENQGTWEIFIGTNGPPSNGSQVIPLIFRVHHCLADGISLVAFLLSNIADEKAFPEVSKRSVWRKSLVEFSLHLYFLFFGPGFAVHEFLTRRKDRNVLHGRRLSGEKILEWVSDDGDMFRGVRRSKKVLGASFTEVLLVAISGGLWEYMKERTTSLPDHITLVVPVYMGDLQDVNDRLENNFSLGMLDLPININGGILERLRRIKEETEYLRYAPDYKLNYMFCKFASKYFPENVIHHCLEQQSSTLSISNVPGPKEQISILDGFSVKDMLFWLPNKGYTGLGISILSYNDKLRLGLLADRAIIENKGEAQKILGNIQNAIKKIDEFASTAHK